ncbi:MAG: beta-phosphoglucomutase family hydrolase [Dehalococcoidia bacterium]|nr:beta-phosphoglucomutase family hydrolase [Dehalococcoidia bacterium]
MPEIAAVIWDMDGVLADTAPHHLLAWQETFAKRGINFTEADFKRGFGIRNDAIIKNVLGEQVTPEEIEAIAREKEATFRRIIGKDIKPLPGALELVKALDEGSIRMAIASSTTIENIHLIVGSLGIADYFKAVITGHDVTEGKPSPQVFLLAAQRLGAEPKNCIVVEDAVAGVKAAKSAGMYCVAVSNTHPKESLGEADLIVASLEMVTVKDLEGLVRSP